MVGNQEEERRSVHFYAKKNSKDMLIFIVTDICNYYNMDMPLICINYLERVNKKSLLIEKHDFRKDINIYEK